MSYYFHLGQALTGPRVFRFFCFWGGGGVSLRIPNVIELANPIVVLLCGTQIRCCCTTVFVHLPKKKGGGALTKKHSTHKSGKYCCESQETLPYVWNATLKGDLHSYIFISIRRPSCPHPTQIKTAFIDTSECITLVLVASLEGGRRRTLVWPNLVLKAHT